MEDFDFTDEVNSFLRLYLGSRFEECQKDVDELILNNLTSEDVNTEDGNVKVPRVEIPPEQVDELITKYLEDIDSIDQSKVRWLLHRLLGISEVTLEDALAACSIIMMSCENEELKDIILEIVVRLVDIGSSMEDLFDLIAKLVPFITTESSFSMFINEVCQYVMSITYEDEEAIVEE